MCVRVCTCDMFVALCAVRFISVRNLTIVREEYDVKLEYTRILYCSVVDV